MTHSALAPAWVELKLLLEQLYHRQPDEVVGGLQEDLLPTFDSLYGRSARDVDPLDAVLIYHNSGNPEHWHYVTFGLCDLYGREASKAGMSGCGHEISFRLLKEKNESSAPLWPALLLRNISRYVLQSRNYFKSGHHKSLNGPILKRTPGVSLTAVAFRHDPQLPTRETASGQVEILQCVGITDEELASMRQWNVNGVLGLLASDNPLLVTDIFRKSLTENEQMRQAIAFGAHTEGSSTSHYYWYELEPILLGPGQFAIRFPFKGMADIRTAVNGRFRFGKELALIGPEYVVRFVPGQAVAVKECDYGLEVTVSDELVAEMQIEFASHKKSYSLQHLPQLVFKITDAP